MDFVNNGSSINSVQQSSDGDVKNECDIFADSVLLDYLTADYESISTEIKKEILFPETNDLNNECNTRITRKRKYSSLSDCVPIELFDNETGECIFHVKEKLNNDVSEDVNHVLWENNSVVSEKINSSSNSDTFLKGNYDLESKNEYDFSTLLNETKKDTRISNRVDVPVGNSLSSKTGRVRTGNNALLTNDVAELQISENDINGLFTKVFEDSYGLNKINHVSVNNVNTEQQLCSPVANDLTAKRLFGTGNETNQINNYNLRANKQENGTLLNKIRVSSGIINICGASSSAIGKSYVNVTTQNVMINAKNGITALRPPSLNNSNQFVSSDDYAFIDSNVMVRSVDNTDYPIQMKGANFVNVLPSSIRQEKFVYPVSTQTQSTTPLMNIFPEKEITVKTDADDLNDLLNQFEEHCTKQENNVYTEVNHMIDHDYCLPGISYRGPISSPSTSSSSSRNNNSVPSNVGENIVVNKVEELFATITTKTNRKDNYNNNNRNFSNSISSGTSNNNNNNSTRNNSQRRGRRVGAKTSERNLNYVTIDNNGGGGLQNTLGSNGDGSTNTGTQSFYSNNNNNNNNNNRTARTKALVTDVNDDNDYGQIITVDVIDSLPTTTTKVDCGETSTSSASSRQVKDESKACANGTASKSESKSVVEKNKLLAYLLTADNKDIGELSKIVNQYSDKTKMPPAVIPKDSICNSSSSSSSSSSLSFAGQTESKLVDENSQFSESSNQSSTSGVFSCFSSAISSCSNSPTFDAVFKDKPQNLDNSPTACTVISETGIKNINDEFGEIINIDVPSASVTVDSDGKQQYLVDVDNKNSPKDFSPAASPDTIYSSGGNDFTMVQRNTKKRHRKNKKERNNCFSVTQTIKKEPYASKERRILYVNKIESSANKEDLRKRFEQFGPVQNISLHFRENGDNYGFVTFYRMEDVFKAMRYANDDPNLPRYAYGIGGRREFCGKRYIDLDASSGCSTSASVPSSNHQFKNFENTGSPIAAASVPVQDDSYESLLKQFKMDVMRRKLS